MADTSLDHPAATTSFFREPENYRWLAASGLLAIGMIVGGYLLGNGLVRARAADRSVTVRGLAERDVIADLATWTISYSETAADLTTAQTQADRDTAALRGFFKELGFPAETLQPTGVNVSQYSDNGVPKFTVRQRMTLRSNDIKRTQQAVRRQFDLVRHGVVLEEGSAIAYTFTRLNDIKPEMVADATRDARASAEQFAKDSGTTVGTIKDATQGYFSVEARDGESGGWGIADTPYKKVRVVTTVNFYLR